MTVQNEDTRRRFIVEQKMKTKMINRSTDVTFNFRNFNFDKTQFSLIDPEDDQILPLKGVRSAQQIEKIQMLCKLFDHKILLHDMSSRKSITVSYSGKGDYCDVFFFSHSWRKKFELTRDMVIEIFHYMSDNKTFQDLVKSHRILSLIFRKDKDE